MKYTKLHQNLLEWKAFLKKIINAMKEICTNLLLAQAAGKVAEGQKCLRQQISEQKKNKGFLAMQGVCAICKKRIKEGRFDLASKESLTENNEN